MGYHVRLSKTFFFSIVMHRKFVTDVKTDKEIPVKKKWVRLLGERWGSPQVQGQGCYYGNHEGVSDRLLKM